MVVIRSRVVDFGVLLVSVTLMSQSCAFGVGFWNLNGCSDVLWASKVVGLCRACCVVELVVCDSCCAEQDVYVENGLAAMPVCWWL